MIKISESTCEPPPRVSVVMAVYNGGSELASTIDSILCQSYDDFEFIIVDDGSTDDSPDLLRRYADLDSRIVVLRQANAGLTCALKRGCSHASGEYIARQDVGDRSFPSRFHLQAQYLDQNPAVVAVGAGCQRIGPEGEFLGESTRDLSPIEVTQAFLADRIGIAHTVAMFRRDAYHSAGGYRTAFRFAQDADLWYRISRLGLLAEIPQVLYQWGIDIGGISASNGDKQRRLASLARESYEVTERDQDDSEILVQAQQVSSEPPPQIGRAAGRMAVADAEFFIGSQLFSLGDQRCRRYLMRAIRQRPMWIRPWAKMALSFVGVSRQQS